MRSTFLMTVAAATLSLSMAAVAQTSGTGSSGASGGAPGASSSDTSSGSGSGTRPMRPQSGMSGDTSGPATRSQQQSQGATSPGQTQQGATSGQAQQGQGTAPTQQHQGTASTRQGQGTAPTQQHQGTASTQQHKGAATTGSTSASINLSGEQRTKAVESLESVKIQPVQEHISVTVGQTLPSSVTHLYDCPQTLVSLLTGVRSCKVVLIEDRYYIVEPSTRRVLTVIERTG